MATANDGISRFSDSTVYGTPTFTDGIGLGSKVPTVGQLGYLYAPAYAGGVGTFTTGVPITYGSQLVPAGTYICSASGTITPAAAVTQSLTASIFITGGIVVGLTQIGDTGNTFADAFNNTMNVSGIFQTSVPITVSFALTTTFNAGTMTATGLEYNFDIVRIA
jgi:hypothetical protein